jgi:hypothetical protein
MSKIEPKVGHVYRAINAVQADLVKEGITKDRRNVQQGYSFRGIDDVYNALAPLLARHALCILPRILSRTCTERESKGGGALFNVVVEAEFDIISAADGSMHTCRNYGEAMDSADKATNKAMSAAYKYAAFQIFAIPTEGEDADADTHQVQVQKPPAQQQQPKEEAKKTFAPPGETEHHVKLRDEILAYIQKWQIETSPEDLLVELTKFGEYPGARKINLLSAKQAVIALGKVRKYDADNDEKFAAQMAAQKKTGGKK